MSLHFLPEIYGVRWGKLLNGKLEIHFEQMNLLCLENIKENLNLKSASCNLHYYVYKECVHVVDGYEYFSHEWVECEKEVILLLTLKSF